jgi:hypothetical protein
MAFLAQRRAVNVRGGHLVLVETLGPDEHRSVVMLRRPAPSGHEWHTEVQYHRTALPGARRHLFEAIDGSWTYREGYALDRVDAERRVRLLEDALAIERARAPLGRSVTVTSGRDEFVNRLSTRRNVGVYVDLAACPAIDEVVDAVLDGRAGQVQAVVGGLIDDDLPTPAHAALARVAPLRKWHIITSRQDARFEAAGAVPWRLTGPDSITLAAETIGPTLLCVGIERDDAGFVQRFRECHPDGLVMAVAPACPPWIRPGDVFLPGDPQEVVPYAVGRG